MFNLLIHLGNITLFISILLITVLIQSAIEKSRYQTTLLYFLVEISIFNDFQFGKYLKMLCELYISIIKIKLHNAQYS